jgi:hypothetical protein
VARDGIERPRQPFQGWVHSGLSYSLQRENAASLSRKVPILLGSRVHQVCALSATLSI